MSLVLKQFEIGPMQNFGYMIADDGAKKALVVDPAWSPAQILETVEKSGYALAGFVVTHAHYDHTNAIEILLQKVDVPVYAQVEEIAYAKSGNSIVGDLGRTARPVRGGEKISLGETEVEFLHTPGHTPGSQCLRVGNYLVTGDTLFVGGCGRTDLPGGDAPTLFKTLQKISTLPGNLVICPGHDYGEVRQRPLENEIAENPYLQMTAEKEFLDAVL
jgi:hydroxyacylglutathione hydrolase